MKRVGFCGCTMALVALAATTGLAAQEKSVRGADKQPSELPLPVADTMSFTANEGSWVSVDVSPDGTTVVFDLLGDLYTVPMSGGEATRLTSGLPWDAQPRYSPDGTKIAFVSDRSGSKNVWLLTLATGEMEALTKGDNSAYMSPDWFPDGKYVVALKGTRLGNQLPWVWSVDGGAGKRLFGTDQAPPGSQTMHVTGVAPSREGRWVWASTRAGRWHYNAAFPQSQIVRYDRETGQTVGQTFRYGSAFRPVPSPDGKWLVYGTRHETQTGLRIRDLVTGDERWLAFPVQHDELESGGELDILPGMDFTPDSRELVASYGGRIWRIPLDGSTPVEVPFRADVAVELGASTRAQFRVDVSPEITVREIRDLAPSPDGSKLAFVALDRLYVVDATGDASPRQLTPDTMSVAWPAWSPDGTRLAVATWTDDGGHIVSVRAQGDGRMRQLTRASAFYAAPAWSPDGLKIVALRGPRTTFVTATGPGAPGQAPDLVWIPAEGGAVTYIAPARGRFHPHFIQGSDRIHLSDGSGRVTSLRWDGTDEKEIVRVVGAPTLASNNQPTGADVVLLSPEGDRALAQVHDQLYVVDVPRLGGSVVTINVSSPAFPVARLTDLGGQFPAWSRVRHLVHWGLGNAHFSYDLDVAKLFADSVKAASEAAEASGEPTDSTDAQVTENDSTEVEPSKYRPTERRIVVTVPRDRPKGSILLKGARVVTMRDDEVLERGDVLMRDGRIEGVGPTGSLSVPSGTEVVDVTGQTILPGFVDTHAHLNGAFGIHKSGVWPYEANLAYGVTTVRDPQTGSTDVLTYSDRVEAGEILGPRVYFTGPGVFGDYIVDRIRSLDQARDVLRRYAEYFDTKTIKMYMAGTRKERQWIAMAAGELGLAPTTEAGQRYMQDLTMMVDGYAGQEHNLPVQPLFSDVVRLAAHTGISYTPTLLVTYGGPWAENYWYTHEDVAHDAKLRRFVPRADLDPKVRRRIRGYDQMGPATGGWFLDEEYTFREHARFVKDVIDAGGRAGIGSHGQLQGLGYHWEMWSVQSGGLTEHETLRIATLQGAEAIGLDQDLGSIEVGKLADLVVLRGNPLTDIRATNTLRYVMKNGRLFDADTLNEVWPTPREFHPSWIGEDDPAATSGRR